MRNLLLLLLLSSHLPKTYTVTYRKFWLIGLDSILRFPETSVYPKAFVSTSVNHMYFFKVLGLVQK